MSNIEMDRALFDTFTYKQHGSLRVEREHAKRWLLENKSMIIGGMLVFLEIKHIGLEVYQVTLRPYGDQYTRLHGTSI